MRMTSIALLLVVGLAAGAQAHDTTTPEQLLAGRTPGAAQSCIPQSRIDSTRTFDSGAILYKMKGGPDYLNAPSPTCSELRQDRAFASQTPSNSICRGDILRVFDPTSHFDYGSCALGDFIPYARAKKP